jgi:hypothetical protein
MIRRKQCRLLLRLAQSIACETDQLLSINLGQNINDRCDILPCGRVRCILLVRRQDDHLDTIRRKFERFSAAFLIHRLSKSECSATRRENPLQFHASQHDFEIANGPGISPNTAVQGRCASLEGTVRKISLNSKGVWIMNETLSTNPSP